MAYQQQSTASGIAYGNQSRFSNGMIGIVESCGQWIVEYCDRLIEGYAMLAEVAQCLGAIPLKLHGMILSRYKSDV